MNAEELKVVIEAHRKWVLGKDGGSRANLIDANLIGANLSDANLRGADLRVANLRGANLRGANLIDANLIDANLSGANLSDANLRWADLRVANLRGADLRGANLSGADLREANLIDANLRGADLRGAYLRGCGGNLSNIKSVWLDTYQVTYTAEVMQIGCQRHKISEWWEFSDERIARMDLKALAWWARFKPVLMQIIELSPAEPTGYVDPKE